MSQSEIEIHFDQMKSLSEELLKVADELKQMVDTEGMETVSKTKAAWISANADIFVGKEVKLFRGVEETAVNLKEISREIYDKAEKIYELEQWNTLTARARSYR